MNRPALELVQEGLAWHRAGQLEKAIALYECAFATQPDCVDALHFWGVGLHERGDFTRAIGLLQAAAEQRPDQAEIRVSLGNALREVGRLDEAITRYRQAIEKAPGLGLAHYNLGTALEEAGQAAQALAAYDGAISCQAGAAAWVGRGNCLLALERPEEALGAYEMARQLDAANADALGNLGSLLTSLGRCEHALRLVDAALQAPTGTPQRSASMLFRCGQVLEACARFEGARTCYEEAHQLPAPPPWLTFQLGALDLLQGRFERGWRRHESRWSTPALHHEQRKFAKPLWLGEDDLGRATLLVHAEQGLGDTVQFCRYLPMVRERVGRLVCEVPGSLLSLLRRSMPAGIEWVRRGEALPSFDRHCPLLSLPLAFATTLTSIPARIPYLEVDEHRTAHWQGWLASRPCLRVGISWSGNARHNNDRNRSLVLEQLAPLLALAGDLDGARVEFVVLQPEIRDRDHGALQARPGLRVPGAAIRDFDDSASLAKLCDLVICVDTAIAHLAGALGCTTWVLLPFVPDWRWLLDRSDSPWYAQTRLYRQTRAGAWPEVIERVEHDLRRLCSGAAPTALRRAS